MSTNYVDKKTSLSQFIAKGAVGIPVVQELLIDGLFLPIEGDLLDYKSAPGDIAKTVLQTVSLHNTYGGYLLFGVEQISETEHRPKGIQAGSLDVKQLRDNIRAYTGESVAVEYAEIPARVAERDMLFGLLWVPKRDSKSPPLAFAKNGPQVDKGRLLFVQGQIYYREQDNCLAAASAAQLSFLLGPRINPFVPGEEVVGALAAPPLTLTHNLPDRNFICPEFVGREEILNRLWLWFADDFSTTRVLAGDGGKGKTSIAYKFAQSLCVSPPGGIERVVWLTAKKRQFNALQNQWVSVPETNFHDLRSLLESLASEMALLGDEISGASEQHLKRQIRDALKVWPALVVIDDVDSLEIEGQRSVLELAMQLASSRSKFLLTTRMNVTFSAESCIPIPGLAIDDFTAYVETLRVRLQLPEMKAAVIQAMWKATGGSPLFADSVLRLVRLSGASPEVAINQWRGLSGDDVRKAALKREVERLSPEARRLLLAASYMQDCSFTEVKQATGYEDERVMMCLNELHSLFLISAPQITQEARYQVASNTAKLVLDIKEEIVKDFGALEARIAQMRAGVSAGAKKDRVVGIAITEANAFKRAKKWGEALRTIDAALGRVGDNADLMLAKGRCLFEGFPARIDEARKLFRESYARGQRSAVLFDFWFRTESAAKSGAGMIDVSTAAIEVRLEKVSDWRTKRALGHFAEAAACERGGQLEAALIELESCAADLKEALEVETSPNDRAILDRAIDLSREEHLRIELKAATELADITAIWRSASSEGAKFGHRKALLTIRFECVAWLVDYAKGRARERSSAIAAVQEYGGELQAALEDFRKKGGDLVFVRDMRQRLAERVRQVDGLRSMAAGQ